MFPAKTETQMSPFDEIYVTDCTNSCHENDNISVSVNK